jgi:DUF1680 family protein
MEINKEELEKYIEAIKAVIDNSLFNDLSKCVDSIIKNIPKLSEHIGLNNSYEINESILAEALRHITGNLLQNYERNRQRNLFEIRRKGN